MRSIPSHDLRIFRARRLATAAAFSLLVALAFAGCGGGAKKEAQTEAGKPAAVQAGTGAPGSQAPSYELADITGKTVSSSEYAGKVVILDFWATWCPPCREEIPHFNALQAKHGDKGLAIVGLSLDSGGAKDVTEFMKEHKIDYKMLIGNDEIAKAFGGVVSIPTTFVIDRQGKIVKRFVGFTPPEVFEETIAPLLAATS